MRLLPRVRSTGREDLEVGDAKTAEGERKSGGLLKESSVEQALRTQGVAEARIAAWPRGHWQL